MGAFQPRVHQDRCSIRSLIGVTSQELHQQVLGPNAKVARMKSKRVRREIRLHVERRSTSLYCMRLSYTWMYGKVRCVGMRICLDLPCQWPRGEARFFFGTRASENKKRPTVCELRLWPSLHLTALVRCLTIGLHYLSVVWTGAKHVSISRYI